MTLQLSRDYSLTTFTQLLQAEAHPGICVDCLEDAGVSEKDAVLMYARDSAACEGLFDQAAFHGYRNGQPIWTNPAEVCWDCKDRRGPHREQLAPENCPTCRGTGILHPPLKPLFPVPFPQAVFAEFCRRRWGEEVAEHVMEDSPRTPFITRAIKRHTLAVVPVEHVVEEFTQTENQEGWLNHILGASRTITASGFVPDEPPLPGQAIAAEEIWSGQRLAQGADGRVRPARGGDAGVMGAAIQAGIPVSGRVILDMFADRDQDAE